MQRWSFKQIAAHADSAWINDTLAGDEIERRLLALGMSKSHIRRMQNGIDLAAITSAQPQTLNTSNTQTPSPVAVKIGVRPNNRASQAPDQYDWNAIAAADSAAQ